MDVGKVNSPFIVHKNLVGYPRYQYMLSLYSSALRSYNTFKSISGVTQDGYVRLPIRDNFITYEVKFQDGVAYLRIKDSKSNRQFDLTINPPDPGRLNSMVISENLTDLRTGQPKRSVVYELFPNGRTAILSSD